MGVSPVCINKKCASDGRDARATSEIGSVKQNLARRVVHRLETGPTKNTRLGEPGHRSGPPKVSEYIENLHGSPINHYARNCCI